MRRSFGSRGEERGDTLAGALVSLLIPAKMVHPGYEDKPPDGHVRNQKLYKKLPFVLSAPNLQQIPVKVVIPRLSSWPPTTPVRLSIYHPITAFLRASYTS